MGKQYILSGFKNLTRFENKTMTTIKLITKYYAPIEKVFDLNRDITIHQETASKSKEIAIAGITSGLINKNETVTWKGKHFGVYLKHKSIISEMIFPTYFVDEQLKGHFKSFKPNIFLNKKKTMWKSLIF